MCCLPLLSLAPRLRHLGVDIFTPSPRVLPQLSRFLPHCTALNSLELHGMKVCEAEEFLRPLPSQLALLTTAELDIDWWDSETKVYGAFLAALSAPALGSIRRWRHEPWEGSMNSEEGKAEWEAACAERGIEIRDFNRRFTGKSMTSPSSR